MKAHSMDLRERVLEDCNERGARQVAVKYRRK